jgi:hypothetical protein
MEDVTERRKQAILEDRERFFKKADVWYFKNNAGLTTKQITELETARQKWRDITEEKGFPAFDDYDPYALTPSWLDNPYFASNWKKDDDN